MNSHIIVLYVRYKSDTTSTRQACLYTKRKVEPKVQLFSIGYTVYSQKITRIPSELVSIPKRKSPSCLYLAYPLPRIRRNSSSVIGVSPCRVCVAVSSPSNISMKIAIPLSDK